MPQKKHKAEEIVAKLRRVDVLLSQGRPVAEATRTISVTPFTHLPLLGPVGVLAFCDRVVQHAAPHSSLGYRPPAPHTVLWPGEPPPSSCQPALKRDPLSAPKRDPLLTVGGNAPDAPELLRWRRRVRRVSGRRGSGQARFLKRQLSFPVSTMSQWWVSRSRSAVVILASPKTLGHSPNARLVVTITDVRS